MEKIGILGAGGQADETESFLKGKEVDFYALTKPYVDENNKKHIDIIIPEEYQRLLPVVAAIGSPTVRKDMVERWAGDKFTTIIAEYAYVDKSSVIGEGSIIAPQAVITTNVEIGKHSIINVAASISHNCKLGNYVTVSPGAHIAGNVELGDGVFVGIGAIISNNIKIANGVVVGAGAVVIRNVDIENSVVVGSPAKIIKQNEGWLSEI